VNSQMKTWYVVRTISSIARWASRCAGQASANFHGQNNKAFFTAIVFPLLLLTCGIGWAAPRPPGGASDWVRPLAAWGYWGAAQPGGQHAARQQQRHQEHLPQWFRQHENMPPLDQERALRSEPGFDRLSPREQQRLYRRLQQLNTMPPVRRERTLQRMEALEKLSPQQRQQVRQVMRQVTQMPDDRRRMMRKAFRNLTQLPPEQRQAILDSPQFKDQFSDQERQMLSTLMSVQPYSPEQRPDPGVNYGGKQ
jgi:hypothetical protein